MATFIMLPNDIYQLIVRSATLEQLANWMEIGGRITDCALYEARRPPRVEQRRRRKQRAEALSSAAEALQGMADTILGAEVRFRGLVQFLEWEEEAREFRRTMGDFARG